MNALSRLSGHPWRIAGGVLVLAAIWVASGALFPSRHEGEAQAEVTAAAVPEVQVARAAPENVERSIKLFGQTAPARIVEIKAETTGRVVATGAARGGQVAEGAVLLRLDDSDRSARLAQARAVLRQRELEFAGQQRLKPQGYISDAKFAESLAQLETARAELRRADIDVARMTIRAPFGGALQDREVEIGDYVSPGTRVATVVDNRRLVVSASVAENQIAAIRTGLAGAALLANGRVVTGQVRYVAPVADTRTRTFGVELEIANADGSLPAGMTAEVEIPTGTVAAVRLSPAVLTLDEQGVVGVKIVDRAGRVQFVPAQVVRSATDGVWVTGLPDAAQVITVGQGFVRPGQAVRSVPTLLAAPDSPAPPLAASGGAVTVPR
jgi:multidrug efflux system membrane fusion protein